MPVIHLKSGSLLVWPASRLEGRRQRARACPDWGRGPVSRPGPPPQGHPSSPVPAPQALQILPGSPSPDPAGIAPETWYGRWRAHCEAACPEGAWTGQPLWRVRVCTWLWPQRAPHPLARTSLESVQAVRGSSSFWGTHGGSLGESHLPGSFAHGWGVSFLAAPGGAAVGAPVEGGGCLPSSRARAAELSVSASWEAGPAWPFLGASRPPPEGESLRCVPRAERHLCGSFLWFQGAVFNKHQSAETDSLVLLRHEAI